MGMPHAQDGVAGDGAEEPGVRFLTREDLPALVQVWTASGLTIRPVGRERPDRLAATSVLPSAEGVLLFTQAGVRAHPLPAQVD